VGITAGSREVPGRKGLRKETIITNINNNNNNTVVEISYPTIYCQISYRSIFKNDMPKVISSASVLAELSERTPGFIQSI